MLRMSSIFRTIIGSRVAAKRGGGARADYMAIVCSCCQTKGIDNMTRTKIGKRAVTLLLAVVMAASVFTISAIAGPPTGDYFYMDADFTTTLPMGNGMIANVQYSTSLQNYYLFFQPDYYSSPYDGHTYIFSINSFEVWDPATSAYVQTIGGATAIVPSSYVQYNSSYQQYLQVRLGFDVYDITMGAPAVMPIFAAYLKLDAFAPF
jgi:hypothetical protein